MVNVLEGAQGREAPIIEARDVFRSFRDKSALRNVSLAVHPGEVHALLGPNGAGKTTLLRILAGLLRPDSGSVHLLGTDATSGSRWLRQRIGFVHSGDRTFYLRISGLENLVFFARLYGMSRKEAFRLSRTLLDEVGLADAATRRVGEYSHGMQKRLSFARALLSSPKLFLVDEATHDLDPKGARAVRALTRELAGGGAAVLWATQRLDEIRGFADRVSLLGQGQVRFSGSVPELMAQSLSRRYLVTVWNGGAEGERLELRLQQALASLGTISAGPDAHSGHYLLSLAEGTNLGEALTALTVARIDVLSCREERSDLEEAFLALTKDEPE